MRNVLHVANATDGVRRRKDFSASDFFHAILCSIWVSSNNLVLALNEAAGILARRDGLESNVAR